MSHSPGGTRGKKSYKAECSQRASIGSVHEQLGHHGKKTGQKGVAEPNCDVLRGEWDSRSIYQSTRFGFGDGNLIWARDLCRAKKYQKQIQLCMKYKIHEKVTLASGSMKADKMEAQSGAGGSPQS